MRRGAVSALPVEVVQSLYSAFARRDPAKVFSLLAAEVEITQSEELQWGGVYRGHDGAQQFFGKLESQINSTLEIERLIRSGDRVVAVGWTEGTVRANGASYRVPVVHIWKVREGLIVQAQFLIDHPTMLEALART